MTAQRDQGRPFALAWRLGVQYAVKGCTSVQANYWRSAFAATREVWQAAYEDEPVPASSRCIEFLAESREQ